MKWHDLRARALSFLQAARGSKPHDRRPLNVCRAGREGLVCKVIKLIGDNVALLKKEQQDNANEEYALRVFTGSGR
jgi:hypothetical protein